MTALPGAVLDADLAAAREHLAAARADVDAPTLLAALRRRLAGDGAARHLLDDVDALIRDLDALRAEHERLDARHTSDCHQTQREARRANAAEERVADLKALLAAERERTNRVRALAGRVAASRAETNRKLHAIRDAANPNRTEAILTKAEPWLQQCGPCELGVDSARCSCTPDDFRPPMLDLYAEVERLRDLLNGGAS